MFSSIGPSSGSRVQSARSVGECSALDELHSFTPSRPRTRDTRSPGSNHRRGFFLSSLGDIEHKKKVSPHTAPRPPRAECSGAAPEKALYEDQTAKAAESMDSLRTSLDKLSSEMRQLLQVSSGKGAKSLQAAINKHLPEDSGSRETQYAQQQKQQHEQKLDDASRELFPTTSLTSRMLGGVKGQGMHKLVKSRIMDAKQGQLEDYISHSQHDDSFFGGPSYLKVIRSDKMNSISSRRVKYKQTSLDSLQHAPFTPRDVSEVQKVKVERDKQRMEDIAMRVEYKNALATASGANAHHCIKIWSIWIVLLQRSRVWAEAIAKNWDPFDEEKRRDALFHPPRGKERIMALTRAGTILTKHYRIRKAARRTAQAATILQSWAINAVKKMKLNVAVHQYLIKVRKIQRNFRKYRAMKLARQNLWMQQWRREETKMLRMAELAKDIDLMLAVQVAKDKESGKHKEASTIGQPVGPHLTQKQRKERAHQRKRVEEFRLMERDTLLAEEFFWKFRECERLMKTPDDVIFESIQPNFVRIEGRRIEEQRKLIRTISSRRAYVEEYCRDTGIPIQDAPDDIISKDPLPTVSGIPKYMRRHVILELMLDVQSKNRYPDYSESEFREATSMFTEFTSAPSPTRKNTIRRKSSARVGILDAGGLNSSGGKARPKPGMARQGSIFRSSPNK